MALELYLLVALVLSRCYGLPGVHTEYFFNSMMSLSSDSWKIKHLQSCRNRDSCSAYWSHLAVVLYLIFVLFLSLWSFILCSFSSVFLERCKGNSVQISQVLFLGFTSFLLLFPQIFGCLILPECWFQSSHIREDFIYLDVFWTIVNVNSLIHQWCWMF